MDRLTLPAPADGLWKRAKDELHRILDHLPGNRPVFKMGGGTMLAARWDHRKSTDVDLTVPDGSGMTEARRLRGDEIRSRMTAAGARRIVLTNKHFVFEFASGIVEITEANPRPRAGTTRMDCGGFPIDGMSTTQIVRGKLERSLKYEPPARDLFDVVVTEKIDPAALEGAVNMLDVDEQRLVLKRWENAAYRINREAPETLHGVRNEFTRFTKDLCRHARESLTNSRYLSVAIRRDGDEICMATRTLVRPNTIRSDVSELHELLERSGMNEYLKNHGPGQATVSERIERALAGGTGAYTPLVTQPTPAPERP